MSGIEFAQADLLELGAIGRTFDVVECSGVLHHLADPFAGWRALLPLLRPGGPRQKANRCDGEHQQGTCSSRHLLFTLTGLSRCENVSWASFHLPFSLL